MARPLLLPLLLALALALVATASGDIGGQKASVDAKIARLHERIAAAHARETQLSGQVAAVTEQIRSLEARVGDVSSKLAVLRNDLALHQRRLDALNALYAVQTQRYRYLRKEYAVALKRLETRLVEIYKQSEPTWTEMLLNSHSIGELLDQIAYFNAVADQDKRIASAVRQAKKHVRAQRGRTRIMQRHLDAETRTVRVREGQVALARDRLLVSQHKLAGARAEKLHALAATRADERAFVDEADALAQVSAALAARIQSAQSSGTAYAGPSSSGLIWPVAGPVTSPFGMRWGRMHEGIDIGAPSGTPIHAAATGRVIYCGWEQGYGNLTVIDHGNGLATAYGHQSSIAVSCGQDVAQGQVIGAVGCTGHCTGPHLHFEVRVNGTAVDPLGYL